MEMPGSQLQTTNVKCTFHDIHQVISLFAGSGGRTAPAIVTPISEGCLDLVRRFLEEGGNPNATDLKRRSLLHYSASYCRVEISKVLLEYGAYANAIDCRGWTPLHLAVKSNDIDGIQLLVSKGANLTIPTSRHGCLPIHVAAQTGCLEAVELMIKRGVNPLSTAADDYTILHYAVLGDHIHVIKFLLGLECKVNLLQAKSMKYGCTAIHLAALAGNHNVVKMLMSHGSNPREKAKDGNDCYGLAALGHHRQCMALVAEVCHSGTLRIGPGDVKVCQEALEQKRRKMMERSFTTPDKPQSSPNDDPAEWIFKPIKEYMKQLSDEMKEDIRLELQLEVSQQVSQIGGHLTQNIQEVKDLVIDSLHHHAPDL